MIQMILHYLATDGIAAAESSSALTGTNIMDYQTVTAIYIINLLIIMSVLLFLKLHQYLRLQYFHISVIITEILTIITN